MRQELFVEANCNDVDEDDATTPAKETRISPPSWLLLLLFFWFSLGSSFSSAFVNETTNGFDALISFICLLNFWSTHSLATLV